MTPLAPSEQLLQVLVNHVTQSENGIAVLDANDRFLYYNNTFARLFGFEDQSMIGQHHDAMLTWMFNHRSGTHIEWPTLQAWLDHVHTRHRSAPFRCFEVDLVNGRWLLLNEQVQSTGEVVISTTDITRMKQTEFALREAQVELEQLAMTDELTETPNRRHFLQQLEREYERAKRYAHPTCLIMLDLDHFKSINDRFGHPAGDEVLRHFADLLSAHLRSEDIIGRLGGEEFAILLPETPVEGALTMLERIRKKLAQAALDEIEPGFTYTFSAGVAQLTVKGLSSCRNWMMEADQALYQAKAAGRNRTEVFRVES